MEVKVIDVSKHNGYIDFEKVRASGIYGVIIRAGFGKTVSQKDPMFERNYKSAKAAGLRTGAYWYSYAASPEEALTEAHAFLEAIRGKTFELPVYLDIEERSQAAKGKDICSAMADNFCSAMESAGYFAGVYSFDSFFASNLNENVKSRYTCWAARVENVKPVFCKKYDMWQYTWKAKIGGISGCADVSYLYRDFEPVIKKAKLNGFGKEPEKRYSITAHISGLDKSEADEVAKRCKSMNMSVVMDESEALL